MCGVCLMGEGLVHDINCLMGACLMWECWVFNVGKGGCLICQWRWGLSGVKGNSLFNGVVERV